MEEEYKVRPVEYAASDRIRPAIARHAASVARQIGWFGVHLVVVYLCAWNCPFWIAAIVKLSRTKSLGGEYQFFFSHLLLLCFIPGFVSGFLNARFRHRVACYVWIVPTVVLAVSVVIQFPEVLFEHELGPALQYYFGSHFNLPEFKTYGELFRSGYNRDFFRGLAQFQTTAPLYASVAYSFAACLSMRLNVFLPPEHTNF